MSPHRPTALWLLERARIARQDAARYAEDDNGLCLAALRLRDAWTLEAWARAAVRAA